MTEAEAQHLIRLTQHALDDQNEFSAHHLRLRLSESIRPMNRFNASISNIQEGVWSQNFEGYQKQHNEEEVALIVRLEPGEGTILPKAELQNHSTILDITYLSSQVPSTSSSSSTLASFIATQLQALFAEEQAIIAHILTSTQSLTASTGNSAQLSQSASSGSRELRSRSNRSLHPDVAARLASRMTRSLKYAPTYHVTVSLFTPSATPSSWDIEAALSEYLMPLLDSISSISNVTVDTQIQLHATFSPSVHSPEYDPDIGVWTLREEDLSGFINAAEWPLSPSIGAGPTLNFIIYVPDQSTSPLVVKGSHASSWLIPQWGGVVILNPWEHSNSTLNSSTPTTTLSKASIRPALLTFSQQLFHFLGAPQSPPSLPLQLQTLTRIRAASLLLSASSTMGSLARLTVALKSIAIPETVSVAVHTTLAQLRRTCDSLKEGNFNEALKTARIAEAEAERGFFEKSMVGQVYFPDEHKVAVYLPLLGPIGVPLLMSAIKEIKRIVGIWKKERSGA